MILKEQKLLETEGNFDTEDEIQIEVAKDEANKLFSILLENYKNARASMIREYVSNAWDAHKEVNSDEPVIVKIDKDDGGWFLEIIDKGVGMTSKFVRKIFSQLLKSTKGNSNEQIGSFGIGSKSGLAYTSQFMLETIKDNIKNSYLIYRESTGLPKILPTEEIASEEKSGTTIKIYLKTEPVQGNYSWQTRTEQDLIAETCSKELTFFDNVIFNFHYSINHYANEYNEGKIIEGKTFKWRTSCQYSSEMHIIIGKVAYPIDWKELSLSSINIPVGIKFEIGELMVNMTREMITYSDEAKELIRNRIEECKKELIEIYNNKNQPIENLINYIKELYKHRRERTFKIEFDVNSDNQEETYDLDISYLKNSLNPVKLACIQHLPIKLKEDNPYFFLSSSMELSNNYNRINKIGLTKLHYLPSDTKLVFLNTNENPDSKIKNKYIKNCYFIRKNHYSFNKWCDFLGLQIIETKFKNLGKKTSFDRSENYYQLGAAKIIYEYKKIILEEVKKNFNWINYNNFQVPNEWIIEQKELNKANRIAKEKLEGVINVRDINVINPLSGKSRQYDLELKTLNNFRGFIIYGYRDDIEDLEKLRQVLINKSKYIYINYEVIRSEAKGWGRGSRSIYENVIYLKENICRIYCISKQNEKVFKNKLFKAYHISEMTQIPQIQRFLTSLSIEKNKNVHLKQEDVKLFNEKISNLIKDVSLFYSENKPSSKEILLELFNKFSTNTSIDNLSIHPEIKYKLKLIDEYFNNIELIRYTNINEESLPYVVDFIKSKKKPVNLNFYQQGKGIISQEVKQETEKVCNLIEKEHQDLTKYWEEYHKRYAQIPKEIL